MSSASLHRRSLVKGAAWTTPAVVVATAAPAHAVSLQTCPTSSCLVHQRLDAPTWSIAVGADGAATSTYVTLNFGAIYIDTACAPAGTTGFMFKVTSVTGYNIDGTPYVGEVTAQPEFAPYVASAGGALWAGVQFHNFAYNGPASVDPDWDSGHWLSKYDITYQITYLSGLDPTSGITAACPFTSTIQAHPDIPGAPTYDTGWLDELL